MKEFKLKEILKGTVPGNMQTVGLMQVIPLTSEFEFKGYVTPEKGGTVGTSNYGTMVFTNNGSDTIIVPANAAYLDKKWGQDHAMTSAGIVGKSERRKSYSNAICIQQSMGGTIPQGSHEFTIMPFSLREPVLNTRKQNSYSRHWNDIAAFNRSLGISSHQGHLEYFYDNFDKELDEFVAEFELVDKQIGAIILINGVVVGIERAPNYEYWKSLWTEIIRSCYGSLAIQVQRAKAEDPKEVEKIRVKLPTKKAKSLDELESILDETETKQKDIAAERIRDLLDNTFKIEVDESVGKTQRVNVKNDDFLGQIVTDGEAVVYASMVTSKKSFHNSKWKKAKEFDI